jgi:hypothetical protein
MSSKKYYYRFIIIYFLYILNFGITDLMTRYNIDDEPPISDLKIFQWRGTSTSKGTFYHLSMDERMSKLLYMYSNM